MSKGNYQGREFKGLTAGASYKKWSALFGFTQNFYRNAIGNLDMPSPLNVLDLGCGPGSLTYALAEKAPFGTHITGIDISEDQLSYARQYTEGYPCKIEFIKQSMGELDFADKSFDLVMSSMALHETPLEIRRKAIKETSRVLKNGGRFLFIDWSKPKLGLFGIIWTPLLLLHKKELRHDNWNNVYKELCEKEGLILTEDHYINSISRRQLYKKLDVNV